jgi:predicted phosphodiesterase
MKTKIFFFLTLILIPFGVFAQSDFGIKYGPYLQNVGENEATVVWVTNGHALGWVEVAPDDPSNFYAEERPKYFETANGRKVTGMLHRVTIKGLRKGTKYRYRIYAREILDDIRWDVQYGKIAASSPSKLFNFTTLDASKDETHFAVINDIHAHNDILDSLVKTVRINELDFMIFNGDMMSHINSEQQLFEGFVNTSVKLFASNLPFFYARGNHETRGPFSTRYMDYFPTSTGVPYYAFKQGPAFFLFLDGGEDKPDSDIEYGGLSAFDAYREEQTEWLKKIVESKEFKEAPVRIVVIHIPPFRSNWYGTLEIERLFVPILNKANIQLMLSGHIHRHSFREKGESDNQFPILVNSSNDLLDIRISGQKIHIKVLDTQGKVFKTFDL